MVVRGAKNTTRNGSPNGGLRKLMRTYLTKEAKAAKKIQAELDHFDDMTLYKVFLALRRSGLEDYQADAAINEMQNDGILFRERIKSA